MKHKKVKVAIALLLGALLLMAATQTTRYRVVNQTVTMTSLNSLANGSSGQSTLVDNNVNFDVDDWVWVTVQSNATGTVNTGTISIYVYSCPGGTTNCDDTVTGADGAVTPTSPAPNLRLAEICNVVANATVYRCPGFSYLQAAGAATMPARWGIVVTNNSGAALNVSGNSVKFDAVQPQSN